MEIGEAPPIDSATNDNATTQVCRACLVKALALIDEAGQEPVPTKMTIAPRGKS